MAVVGRPVNQSSNTQLQRTELNSPVRESAQGAWEGGARPLLPLAGRKNRYSAQ